MFIKNAYSYKLLYNIAIFYGIAVMQDEFFIIHQEDDEMC